MHQKSQTRSFIQSFFKLVATQFNLKIKTLRSNNGVKFHMEDFFSLLKILYINLVMWRHFNKTPLLKENANIYLMLLEL
jgi:hypothetical protein